MKFYVNKSTSTGEQELIGPFSTQEEADEKRIKELTLCSIDASMKRLNYSLSGNTITFEDGTAIHFSLFSECGNVDKVQLAS